MCSIKIFKNKDVLSCSLDDTEEVPLHEVDAVVSEESKLSSSDCIILHVESKKFSSRKRILGIVKNASIQERNS